MPEEAKTETKRKSKFAWRASTIFDDLGRRLDERTVVRGTAPDDFSRFIGFGHATVKHPNVADPIHGEFRFPVPAEGIDEALDKYDEALAAKLQDARDEIYKRVDEQVKQALQAQNAIVPANSIPNMPPVGPGGGPGGRNGRIQLP